jgi:hypothetical protein
MYGRYKYLKAYGKKLLEGKTCIYFKMHLNWQVEDVLIYLFAVCRIVDITHQAKNILI